MELQPMIAIVIGLSIIAGIFAGIGLMVWIIDQSAKRLIAESLGW